MKTNSQADCVPVGTLHKLRLDLIRPGDVLLTRSPGQATSKIVQCVTSSPFSHAILVLDLPWAIESTKYGVVKFRLDRMAFKNPANGCLRRSRAAEEGKLDIGRLIEFAEGRVAAPYAKKEVLASIFRSMPQIEPGSFFCSQLIAEAYRASGFGLIDALPPERITPAIFASSPLFISKEPFTGLDETASLALEHSFFDAHSLPSFAQRESGIKQAIFRRVRHHYPLQTARPETFDDLLLALATLQGHDAGAAVLLDQAFCRAISEERLVSLLGDLMPADSETFFVDFYLTQALARKAMSHEQMHSLQEFYRENAERFTVSNSERQRAVQVFRQLFMLTGLESVRLVLAAAEEAHRMSLRVAETIGRCVQLLDAANQMKDDA